MIRGLFGFVVIVTLALLVAPLTADAQGPVHVPRLGFLGYDSSTQAQSLQGFLDELRAFGHVDGQTIAIEYRWVEGHFDHLPALAAELVGLPVDILVTAARPLAVHAAQQTTTTPIVAAIMNDLLSGTISALRKAS